MGERKKTASNTPRKRAKGGGKAIVEDGRGRGRSISGEGCSGCGSKLGGERKSTVCGGRSTARGIGIGSAARAAKSEGFANGSRESVLAHLRKRFWGQVGGPVWILSAAGDSSGAGEGGSERGQEGLRGRGIAAEAPRGLSRSTFGGRKNFRDHSHPSRGEKASERKQEARGFGLGA